MAYALPDDSFWQEMSVPAGTTVGEAIEKSGVLQRFAELNLDNLSIGIYALPVKRDKILEPGDRVEIYRALLVDPKSVPRKARSKAKGKAKSQAKVEKKI